VWSKRGCGVTNPGLGRGKRIVVLGAGFAGMTAARELCRHTSGKDGPEIWLVDRNNFLLFTPMLTEVAGGELDPRHIVAAPQRLSPHVRFLQGAVQGWWEWAPCASWTVRDADRYTGPWDAKTRSPVLVIGTRYDPNTGYANAKRVAGLLGNAVLLTHEGYGHLSFKDPSACVERAESAYLVYVKTPLRGTVCKSDHQPFGAPANSGSSSGSRRSDAGRPPGRDPSPRGRPSGAIGDPGPAPADPVRRQARAGSPPRSNR
jgi:hypothetical protein